MNKVISSVGNRVNFTKIGMMDIDDICPDGSCVIEGSNLTPPTNDSQSNTNADLPSDGGDNIPSGTALYYFFQDNCQKCTQAKTAQQYIDENTDLIQINVSSPKGLTVAKAMGVSVTPTIVLTHQNKIHQKYDFAKIVQDPDIIIDTVENLLQSSNGQSAYQDQGIEPIVDKLKQLWSTPAGKVVVGGVLLGLISGFFTPNK